MHFFRFRDTQLPVEQDIDVPKIAQDIIQPRTVDCDLRHPQIAEQLVEVPTILSFASLQQQTAEHIVDNPVPHGRGGSGGGGLHGFSQSRILQCSWPSSSLTIQRSGGLLVFLPEQDSTALVAEQLVHNPLRSGGLRIEHLVPGGSVHGSRPDQSSTAFGRAEHLVLGGSLHGIRPDQGSTAFFGARHVHHQDFSQGQSSTAVRRDGGPGGGPDNFVPGQSSTALNGADDVEDLIRRSQELLEYSRREYSFRWTLRSSPHASKAIFAPNATVPPSSASSTRMYRDNGMQPEFQQSVLFFSPKVAQFQFMVRVLDIPVVCRVLTLVVDMAVARTLLVLPVTTHLSLCSFCL